jgi:hypothetical protein
MCDVLGWDRSGYYAWRGNKEARQEKADAEEDLARRSGTSTPVPGAPTALAGSRRNCTIKATS